MATKMKGLLKGLRYISQIFEEDKEEEEEMQIGLPTDVKHVAHIGWDGPSQVGSSPSWMKEFPDSNELQSAPLDSNGKTIKEPEIKWVSEDSKKGNGSTDSPEVPRSSRRQLPSDNNNSNELPRRRDPSARSRHSRRNNSKDSSEGGAKLGQDELGRPDSPSRAHHELAKKSRRKKSKETDGGGTTRLRPKDSDGGSTRSRSKDQDGGSNRGRSKDSEGGSTRSRTRDSEGCGSSRSRTKHNTCGASAHSDPGQDAGSIDEEKERRAIS